MRARSKMFSHQQPLNTAKISTEDIGKPERREVPIGGDADSPVSGILDSAAHSVDIEVPSANQKLNAIAAQTKFMEEVLTIFVSEPASEERDPYVTIHVNNNKQFIHCGVPSKVKRKYVEVLARTVETKYKQITPSASEIHNSLLKPATRPLYPFQVMDDPSGALGAKWLERIVQDAHANG